MSFRRALVIYGGGEKPSPTYREVSAGDTGYAETLEVIFDADKVSFDKLAKLFFEIHDPTEKNRQGPDIGSQYRSAIFYVNMEQKETAEKLMGILKEKKMDVVTELIPVTVFYETEEYHQKYYAKNSQIPFCQIKRALF